MDPSSLDAKRQLLVQHPILEEAVEGESGSVDVEAMNIALPDVKKIIADRPTYCHALVGGCLERDFKHYHCQLLQPHGAFFTDRSFQVQWRWKGVKMAQQRSRRKKVSWSKS
uniref:Uncharacterized protein n=1 Tax=Hyaloperonospora arabidopsidis (strain Emoy2) TaxID=559515 RepID=M4BNA0_HYAAE